MAKYIKDYIKNKVRSTRFWWAIMSIKSQKEMQYWFMADRPSPPPHAIKARNILTMADLFNLSVMVETGTLYGQMIDATLDRFKQIYSIEIYEPLALMAIHRFAGNP